MKILQIVTYISPDGAYGGPVRVAINQAKALTDLGHEVVLAAAAGGFDGPLPTTFDGFPVRLFPARQLIPRTGFAGLVSPRLATWLPSALKHADVVHVHLARDLITLPAALMTLLFQKALLVQTHGMIDRTEKHLAKPLDALLTKPVLRMSKAVLHLTDRERKDLIEVAGPALNFRGLPNAVPVPDVPAVEQRQGPATNPEVLFLARIHERKRPVHFVRAALRLTSTWPQARFTLVGPDEGEGDAVRRMILEGQRHAPIRWNGPLSPDQTLDRMRNASIYALPSVDEPFPMSVLEAMALGLPVIVTDTCGLAPMVSQCDGGIVVDSTLGSLTDALEMLLQDPETRTQMGSNGRLAVQKHCSTDDIGRNLANTYIQAIKG
ncbi:glycosyltransferase [Kocuria rhizosphaericola]|uniref:glycosyltransferase n=1 Tax=Kocuria rhizosphaericola TaxID=3376284 RepID=UPI0037AC52FC